MPTVIDGITGINRITGGADVGGNLDFVGSGVRITGDFSNVPQAIRALLQTNVLNGNTTIGAIPNGTGNDGSFVAFGGSNPDDASYLHMGIVGGDHAYLNSGRTGAASNLTFDVKIGGATRLRMSTADGIAVYGAGEGGEVALIRPDGVTTGGFIDYHFGTNTIRFIHGDGGRGIRINALGHVEGIDLASPGGASGDGTNILFTAPGFSGGAALAFGRHVLGNWVGLDVYVPQGNVHFTLRNDGKGYSLAGWVLESDVSLKTNITPIDNALQKLGMLFGSTFNRVDLNDAPMAGIVAQDLQKVLPEAVSSSRDGILAIDPMGVIAILVQAVKELTLKVTDLEAKLPGDTQ